MEGAASGRRTKKTDIRQIDFGKVPPQSVELEESVLGALMIEKDAFTVVADILK
ncbi:MAG: replicative DNA helicase, partial [bacterium]|nr:replicative DNA helicase [Candidatus Aphodosoma intestinipullorum]